MNEAQIAMKGETKRRLTMRKEVMIDKSSEIKTPKSVVSPHPVQQTSTCARTLLNKNRRAAKCCAAREHEGRKVKRQKI